MHDHTPTCKHDLKVCDHCDVAYCTQCKKGWGNHQHVNYVPAYPVYPPLQPAPYWYYQPFYVTNAWGTGLTTTTNALGSIGGLSNNTLSLS